MTSRPDEARSPDLTFPNLELGSRETTWNLSVLLYLGGPRAPTSHVGRMISDGQLGKPLNDRLPLVTKIHEAINAQLVGGRSSVTAKNEIWFVRIMFQWAEAEKYPLDLESVQRTFLSWTDSLIHRQQILKNLSQTSAYTMGAGVGCVLDAVLNRNTPLISISRLRLPSKRKAALGISAEKQNLADTFAFGHFLQDICDALSAEIVLKGPLPVRIPLRRGGELVEWCAYQHRRFHELPANLPEGSSSSREHRSHQRTLLTFRAWETDGTLRTRYPLANRRIEAELLMFIGQTGMNFTQAHQMKLRHFSYSSYIDGYQVRERKARRGGEVLFEIFKEYKPHFERYLDWRRELFPESDAVFPFIRKGGRSFQTRPQFRLRATCKRLGLRFVPPQDLRNTRVNWLLRRSGDADLTASMAQHQKETLLGIYERPSQQRAMAEIIRFWSKHDPTLNCTDPVGPGQCDGKPVQLELAPDNAPMPDCFRPSGCMWCEHHRDIDSQDYLWSLASFRHLKVIELSKWVPPQSTKEISPAQLVIDRISEKLHWFNESNERRREWVQEALARVEEGSYHTAWVRSIAAMEGAL